MLFFFAIYIAYFAKFTPPQHMLVVQITELKKRLF